MMSRVTDFALVILWLLIDKVCEIIEISKIEFFNLLKVLIHLWIICNTNKKQHKFQAYASNNLWLYVQAEIFFFLTYVIWCSPSHICAFDNFPEKLFSSNRKSNKNKNKKNNLQALHTTLTSKS